MRKRILAFSVALVLLLSTLSVGAAAADTELLVIAPEALPAVGEEFTVTVEISGNPGLLAAQFTLVFDQEHLECVDMEAGDVMSKAMFAANPEASDGARFAAASSKAMNGDSSVCELTFRLMEKVDSLSFSLENASFTNAEGKAVALTLIPDVIEGTIENTPSVSESDQPSAPEPDKPAEGETDKPKEDEKDKPDEKEKDKPKEDEKDKTNEKEKDKPDEKDKPKEEEKVSVTFPDIGGHWGESYIVKAAEQGLFNGFEDGTFRPNGTVTRGQFVTVLWRMAGKPAPAAASPFEDVAPGAWYADAVAWAHEKGYVNGRTDTTFDPDGSISRQEAMKVLFYFNGGASGMETMFSAVYDGDFTDSGEIADWAKPAMYWGFYNGIINGKTPTTLCPTDTATRAELAKILVVYGEKFSA